MRNHWISLISLPVLILASCGASQTIVQNENPAPAPLTNPQFTATEQPNIPPVATPTSSDVSLPNMEIAASAPRAMIEKAKSDLVKQFSVDANQIRVVEARAVDWPDASLGCPQSDMTYAQVISPGYWVLLEAEGRQYPYHTDQNEQIILCLRAPSDPSSLPLIPVNPGTIDDGQPWVPVD